MIPLLPARHVHIGTAIPYIDALPAADQIRSDQTPASAVRRVELHAPEEIQRLQTGRVRIIK